MPSVALKRDDLLVEYRNKSLGRDGSIPIEDLRLKMQPVYNGVGAWTVQLPAEHRAVPYLRAPGAGIIVTNLKTGQTLLSGSTSKPSKRSTVQDPKGMATISGLTDDRLLWDALAFADPANADPAAATTANDVRTAQASQLMRIYVNRNIGGLGGLAPAGRIGTSLRSFIGLGADPALGPVTTRRPRYDILGDLLYGIAQEAGLGFRLVQVGTTLQFQVYQPVNRTSTIRLDIHNGTLQNQEVEHAPPEVTRMIVAGQGEGVERQMINMSTTASTAAEDDWGLIIEEFKDQRNTAVVDELEAAGLERLNEAGFTKVALKAVPSNDQTMIFLTDFFMGDRVSVVVEDQEQPNSIITEAAIVVDDMGITTAVAIGDIADFDSDSYLRQQLTDTQKRVDNLERNAEVTSASVVIDLIYPVGSILMSTDSANPSTRFGGTWAAWGTGRVPVGVSTGETEFNTVQKTGGAKTHTLAATEIPAHQHRIGPNYGGNIGYSEGGGATWYTVGYGSARVSSNDLKTGTQDTTVGQAHNNLQPYITCYMWRRTA